MARLRRGHGVGPGRRRDRPPWVPRPARVGPAAGRRALVVRGDRGGRLRGRCPAATGRPSTRWTSCTSSSVARTATSGSTTGSWTSSRRSSASPTGRCCSTAGRSSTGPSRCHSTTSRSSPATRAPRASSRRRPTTSAARSARRPWPQIAEIEPGVRSLRDVTPGDARRRPRPLGRGAGPPRGAHRRTRTRACSRRSRRSNRGTWTRWGACSTRATPRCATCTR